MRFVLFAVFAALADGDLLKIFREAMHHAGCADKEAYTDMAMSQSQFSKQMAGVEPPRFLSRIWKIKNRDVARWYWFLLCEKSGGAPKELKRGMGLLLVSMGIRRVERRHRAIKMQIAAASGEKKVS